MKHAEAWAFGKMASQGMRRQRQKCFIINQDKQLLKYQFKIKLQFGFRGREASGFRDVSHSRDLDASFSICKLNLLTYIQ